MRKITSATSCKGNFSGKKEGTYFTVNPFDINKIDSVKVYAGLAPKSVTVTINDNIGAAIAAKNYTIKIEKNGVDVTTSKEKLKDGDKIDVTVTGKNSNVTGSWTENDITAGEESSVIYEADRAGYSF